MRAKIVIPLLLVGLFVVLLPFASRRQSPASGRPAIPVIPAAKAPAPGDVLPERNESNHQPGLPDNSLPDANITIAVGADEYRAANYEDYVNRRIAKLEDLGMTGDAGALVTIESELDSRDPRIQAAAVSAIIQFGSRAAIPALREAYGHTDDPAQKLRVQQAIEFLALPSESETANASLPVGEAGTAN